MERNHFILNVRSYLLILLLSMTGCATTSNLSGDFNPDDPYEKSNRKVFEFNNKIDKLLILEKKSGVFNIWSTTHIKLIIKKDTKNPLL